MNRGDKPPATEVNNHELVVQEIKKALAVTEDVFMPNIRGYTPPKVVLVDKHPHYIWTRKPKNVDPHYNTREKKIYINPEFFRNVVGREKRIAIYYIIFHEVAHHVQMNYLPDAEAARKGGVPELLIRTARELQADYIAGTLLNIMHKQNPTLENGDAEALGNAAMLMGDDIQGTGDVQVDGIRAKELSHGTSWMRKAMVISGLQSSSINTAPSISNLCNRILEATKTEMSDWENG